MANEAEGRKVADDGSQQASAPRLTVITLGVSDVARSRAFYERLGFRRRYAETGDAVAFFETGASVLALYGWEALAEDAGVAVEPRPAAFRGVTLAWNCASQEEVDRALAQALQAGAVLVRPAGATDYGGYRAYVADPDGHLWEIVTAPGIVLQPDGRVALPE